LSEWQAKGLEIYAAIESEEEVKAMFPPVESQQLLDRALSLLGGSEANKMLPE